jgi:hypothetical protein
MQQRAESLARDAEKASLGDDFARAMLQTLAALDSEFQQPKESRELIFRRAQRLVPALNRLAVAAGLDSDVSPRPENRQLMEAIQLQDSFDPIRFAKAIAVYRVAINGSSATGSQ